MSSKKDVYAQLVSMQFENVAADPTPLPTTIGRGIFRTDLEEFKIQCNATTWKTLSSLNAVQTFTNKTFTMPVVVGGQFSDAEFTNPLCIEDVTATPATPAAGHKKVYIKDDVLTILDETGAEQTLFPAAGPFQEYVTFGATTLTLSPSNIFVDVLSLSLPAGKFLLSSYLFGSNGSTGGTFNIRTYISSFSGNINTDRTPGLNTADGVVTGSFSGVNLSVNDYFVTNLVPTTYYLKLLKTGGVSVTYSNYKIQAREVV